MQKRTNTKEMKQIAIKKIHTNKNEQAANNAQHMMAKQIVLFRVWTN